MNPCGNLFIPGGLQYKEKKAEGIGYSILFAFSSLFFFSITMMQVTAIASSSSLITRELAQNETDLAAMQAFKSKIIHGIDFCTIL
ncbi:hypothetical protein Patl1_06602 [Pistacia atlantica]|uniref:Uncharacterized protein n=1 Tax=Pistacia atlantica TaxID=434234 RepID=A0ACC1BQS2_9ROSI|nr:hypothetical protein Patl1_06602 [Pistacia atlantica]